MPKVPERLKRRLAELPSEIGKESTMAFSLAKKVFKKGI
jgi:hypothetical protein